MVSDGNTFASCGTNAMPCRVISRGLRPPIGLPSKSIAPSRVLRNPAIDFSNVDLPAPFGPISTTISRSATLRLTPLSTSSCAPYPATTLVRESIMRHHLQPQASRSLLCPLPLWERATQHHQRTRSGEGAQASRSHPSPLLRC